MWVQSSRISRGANTANNKSKCDPPVTIRFDTVDYHGKTVGANYI